MRKYNENGVISFLKRAANITVISIISAAFIFAFSSEQVFYQFLLNETLPYLNDVDNNFPVLFKLDNEGNNNSPEYENTVPAQEVFDSESDIIHINDIDKQIFNASEIETSMESGKSSEIVGINDIVFQDEEEFGTFPDVSYKENFTAENIGRLTDIDFFLSNFYNKDANTGIIKDNFDPVVFFNTNLKEIKDISKPQVLIFHTHGGTEYFFDSDTSNINEGIIGVGEELKYMLEQKYGIRVMHHTQIYDMENGVSNRDGSYERMEPDIKRILEENPSIKIAVDLHRDGIEPNPNLVTTVNGEPCAKIMFVNGISAVNEDGVISEVLSLPNENLAENLAFSFNMQIAANEIYPDFTRKIYLKPYRYSTFMLEKSLLVEVGSQYSTKEEVLNAMEPLADLINNVVFSGD